MQRTVNKVAYLDGIRGVAAFIVVIHHFLLAFYPAYYNCDENASHLNGWDIQYGRSLYSVFSNGNFCVCVFFVLSGFVLSRKYFASHAMETLISGAHRRFIRLYIPIAATIIIATLMMKLNLFYNMQVAAISHSNWWFGTFWGFKEIWDQFYPCILYRTMLNGDSTFDTSMWTISTELYGSLFVFAFLALTHATRNRRTMIVLSILCCYYTNNAYMSAFLLGIGLNYTEAIVDGLSKRFRQIIPVLLLAAGLMLGSYPSTNVIIHTFYSQTPQFFVINFNPNWYHSLGAYLLILSFVLSGNMQRFVSGRVFRLLGYISFSIYLLHPLVLGSVTSYVFLHLYPHLSYNTAVVFSFFVTVAVCIPVSLLMAKYIDAPGIRLAKYLYTRYAKKSEPAHISQP